jgi:hypothetical protein
MREIAQGEDFPPGPNHTFQTLPTARLRVVREPVCQWREAGQWDAP